MRGGLYRVHRWVGVTLALVAIWLALTGVALTHAHDWQLDRQWVRQDWLLDAYGLAPGAPAGGYALADGRWVSQVGRHVFVDTELLAEFEPMLVGAQRLDQDWLLAARDRLLLLDAQGRVIETLRAPELPGRIEAVAAQAATPAVQTPQGWFAADPNWHWQAIAASVPARMQPLPPALARDLGAEARRHVLSWERVMADLHAGRLAGGAAKLILDLSAALLCLLGISGLILFFRGQRRQRARRGG